MNHTFFRLPPTGSEVVGVQPCDYIQFFCAVSTELVSLSLLQDNRPEKQISKMKVFYKEQSDWFADSSTFETNSELVNIWWKAPTALPTAAPSAASIKVPATVLVTGKHQLLSFGPRQYWRLEFLVINTNGWEAYFYDVQFYDSYGNEISGTYTSSRGNTNIDKINDADLSTSFRIPSVGSLAPGDYIDFTCSDPAEIKRVTIIQDSNGNSRVWQMVVKSSNNLISWDM